MFFVCDELYLWSYKFFWPGKVEGISEEGDSITLNLLLLMMVKMMASRRLQLICILKHDGPGSTQISKVYSLAEMKTQKSSALT
jgi:hypothetical protein